MVMSAAAFLVGIRRRAPVASQSRDPLADARRFLDARGETGEGQALRKVLTTLATGDGTFAEAEAWLFSGQTLGLVAALVEARIEGQYSANEWLRFQGGYGAPII
jgi:hypothetical protein